MPVVEVSACQFSPEVRSTIEALNAILTEFGTEEAFEAYQSLPMPDLPLTIAPVEGESSEVERFALFEDRPTLDNAPCVKIELRSAPIHLVVGKPAAWAISPRSMSPSSGIQDFDFGPFTNKF